jgi:hypothetical protein
MSRELAAIFERKFPLYVNDPGLYAWDVFGIRTWDRQEELLQSVAHNDRSSCTAGHKVSKSNSAAILSHWWASTRKNARVIITAPSARQIRNVIWREVRALHRVADKRGLPLGGVLNETPDNGFHYSDGREILGFSTNEPDRMNGISGENVLWIIDEGSGVPNSIYESIEGNLGGGGRILVIGNPLRPVGYFADSHRARNRKTIANSDGWIQLRIPSTDSPNARSGQVIIPGLALRAWCEARARIWGVNSALYKARVLGMFPDATDYAVIGLAVITEGVRGWSDEATLRADGDIASLDEQATLSIGVDVARSITGDHSTVVPVRGRRMLEPLEDGKTVFRGFDSDQLAGAVLNTARRLRRRGEKPRVNVDLNGWGGGVFDILKKCDEIEAYGINVSERSDQPDDFPNIRSQLWFGLADWFGDDGTIPEDALLEEELAAPEYSFDKQGRRVVDDKETIKGKIDRSPDRADGLALAVYKGKRTAKPVRYTSQQNLVSGSYSPI